MIASRRVTGQRRGLTPAQRIKHQEKLRMKLRNKNQEPNAVVIECFRLLAELQQRLYTRRKASSGDDDDVGVEEDLQRWRGHHHLEEESEPSALSSSHDEEEEEEGGSEESHGHRTRGVKPHAEADGGGVSRFGGWSGAPELLVVVRDCDS